MERTLEQKLEQAVWAAHVLFERGTVKGNTGNISIRHGDKIYISASGTCFGTLKLSDFAVMDLEGNMLEKKASKEWPLHLSVYRHKPDVNGVIHTHSTYAVLWGTQCVPGSVDVMPDFTPYLRMKLGTVSCVEYGMPGSEELFAAFEREVDRADGWLLFRHGTVVPGKTILDAFYAQEELEETARILWELQKRNE